MILRMSITAEDLQAMVSHWLATQPNSYLGSGYGAGVRDLLQSPLNGPGADALIAKLRTDIAIMAQLPADALNVYAAPDGPDKLRLFFEVSGALVPIALTPAT